MAKCILLIRVSSKQQDFSAQKNELIQYAIDSGYKKASQRILIENKESAIKLDEEHRQGITEMKAYIEEDKCIDCVYAWEISRVSRRYDVIESVRDFLIEHKVNLKLYHEGVQLLNSDGTINTGGKLVVDVSMAIAKYEMETKTARLTREKEQKTKEGKTPTGRVLYGYKINDEGYVEVDEELTAPRVREIFNWSNEGKSTLWIWNECLTRGYFPYKSKKSGKNYIGSILKQPAYCGREGYRTKTKYKAIITEKLFDDANKARDERLNLPKTTSKFVAYGRGLVRYVSEEGNEYAMSIGHSRNSYRTSTDAFPIISINMNVVDYILWRETVSLYTIFLIKQGEVTLRQLQKEKKVLQDKLDTSKKALDQLVNRKKRRGDRYELGDLTRREYEDGIKEINREIKNVEERNADYQESLMRIDKQIQGIGDERWAKIDINTIKSINDDSERKKMIDTIITNVLISPFGFTDKGDKKYKIKVVQKVNWLYNTYFEYWQRGGVFHLIRHSFSPAGKKVEYVKDISKEIERRFPSDWSIRHKK